MMKIRPWQRSTERASLALPDPQVFANDLSGWLTLTPSASPLEVYAALVCLERPLTGCLLEEHVDEILDQLCGTRLVALPRIEPIPGAASLLTVSLTHERLPYHQAFQVVLATATEQYAERPYCGARRHITRHGPAVLEWVLYDCSLESPIERSDWPEDTHLATITALLYPSRLPLEIELSWEITADASKLSWEEFADALYDADLPARLARLAGRLTLPRRLR
jgi:hypothetical protein